MKENLILCPIPLEDLENTIAKIVREEISKHSSTYSPVEDFIDTNEVAKIYGVSPGTIRNWRIRGILKSHKIASRVRFKRKEVMEALSQHSKYRK